VLPKDYDRGGYPRLGDAAAGVVMTAPLRNAGHHRQYRLGTVYACILLFSSTDGMFGWIMVKANGIDDVVHELRNRGQLETVG
jgi:hypothetical protein